MFFIEHTEMLDGWVTVVNIKGALNSETSSNFEEYINGLLEKKKEFIILDAQHLDYVSSNGIGLILYIQKKLSSHYGFFIILNLPDEIKTLFSLLGFDKIFTVARTMDEALQMMEKQIEVRDSGDMQPSDDMNDVVLTDSDLGRVEVQDKKHAIPITGEHIEFTTPVIAECTECKSLIRIKKSGNYLCPDCHAEFTVDQDQTILF